MNSKNFVSKQSISKIKNIVSIVECHVVFSLCPINISKVATCIDDYCKQPPIILDDGNVDPCNDLRDVHLASKI